MKLLKKFDTYINKLDTETRFEAILFYITRPFKDARQWITNRRSKQLRNNLIAAIKQDRLHRDRKSMSVDMDDELYCMINESVKLYLSDDYHIHWNAYDGIVDDFKRMQEITQWLLDVNEYNHLDDLEGFQKQREEYKKELFLLLYRRIDKMWL